MTLNGETWDVGIRDGTFENVSGVMRSSADGQVIENKNFWDGSLEIAHNDVVVRNCYFRNLGFHTLYQLGGAQNCLVELCTFDGRPDGQVVNASNADFTFAHNRPMTVRQCIFLDASNDILNFVGGLCEKNVMIGAGFTAAAHSDAISVHTTVDKFLASKNYIDNRQRPGAVIPNATLKYVSVPSIGEGQGAGNGIAHEVAAYDNVLLGGGYVTYLDTTYSKVSNNIVDDGYWYASDPVGDVYPPVPSGYTDNKKRADVADDYVSIAVSGAAPLPPDPGPDPDDGSVEEQIEDLWTALADTNESLKATNDRLELLVANLHQA
jgi:hypothetical protein